MKAAQFSPIRKYQVAAPWGKVVDGLRISVSEFTLHGEQRLAIALERKTESGWKLDNDLAFETPVTVTIGLWEADRFSDIHKATGNEGCMGMGYFTKYRLR